MCLSETWLHEEIADNECNIEGFSLHRCDRDTRGGGVAVYINRRLMFDIIEGILNSFLYVYIDLVKPTGEHILVYGIDLLLMLVLLILCTLFGVSLAFVCFLILF